MHDQKDKKKNDEKSYDCSLVNQMNHKINPTTANKKKISIKTQKMK